MTSFFEKVYRYQLLIYIFSCVPYTAEPENTTLLQTAVQIFRKFDRQPEALRLAMQLNDMDLIEDIFHSCDNL